MCLQHSYMIFFFFSFGGVLFCPCVVDHLWYTFCSREKYNDTEHWYEDSSLLAPASGNHEFSVVAEVQKS